MSGRRISLFGKYMQNDNNSEVDQEATQRPMINATIVNSRRKSIEAADFLKITQQIKLEDKELNKSFSSEEVANRGNFSPIKDQYKLKKRISVQEDLGFERKNSNVSLQAAITPPSVTSPVNIRRNIMDLENSQMYMISTSAQEEALKLKRQRQREAISPLFQEYWRRIFRKLVLMNRAVNAFLDVLSDIHKFGTKGKEGGNNHDTFIRILGPDPIRRNTLAQSKKLKCLILPDSGFSFIWAVNLIILLVWTAIYLPYRLAFLNHVHLSLLIIETIVDGVFLIDIILSFLTAYYDEDNILIVDRRKIAKRYLKTWFIIDLIACFPVQLFETQNKYSKAVRLLRLPRLYKLLKFLRVIKLLNFIKSETLYKQFFFLLKLNSGVGRLFKVLITMGFFIHLYGCLWYLIAKLRNFPPDCWVVQLALLDTSNYDKYIACFYWVLQTLTTVGYGDMPVTGTTERTFTIILMIFGVGFYSYTIGNLSSIFAIIDSRQGKLNSKILSLNEFAYNIGMPPHLYLKIVKTLTNNSATGNSSYFDQDLLLEELPSALRHEVMSCTHQKILNSFSFFKDKPAQFVIDILPKFKHHSISQDEVLFRKGELVEEVYFLLEGRVAFITGDGYLCRNFVQGSYFGETELFKGKQFRLLSAITMTDVELLVVKKHDLEKILENYPCVKDEMHLVAGQRYNKNVQAQNIARKADFKLDPGQFSLLNVSPGMSNISEFFRNDIRPSEEDNGGSSSSSANSSVTPSQEAEDQKMKNIACSPLNPGGFVLNPIMEEEEAKEGTICMTRGSAMTLGFDSAIIADEYNTEEVWEDLKLQTMESKLQTDEMPDFNTIVHKKPRNISSSSKLKKDAGFSQSVRLLEQRQRSHVTPFEIDLTFVPNFNNRQSNHTNSVSSEISSPPSGQLINRKTAWHKRLARLPSNISQESASSSIQRRKNKEKMSRTNTTGLLNLFSPTTLNHDKSLSHEDNAELIADQLTLLLRENQAAVTRMIRFNQRILNVENKILSITKKKSRGTVNW